MNSVIRQELSKKAEEKGWNVRLCRALDENAEKQFLFVALCRTKGTGQHGDDSTEYGVFLYNSTDKGFYEGQYTTNIDVALEKYKYKN